jgi:hypothetical protein
VLLVCLVFFHALPLVLFLFVAFATCASALFALRFCLCYFSHASGVICRLVSCADRVVSPTSSRTSCLLLMPLQRLCCLAFQYHSFPFVQYIYCRFFALVRLLVQVFASWSRCLHSTRYAYWLMSSRGRVGVLVYMRSIFCEAGCALSLEFPLIPFYRGRFLSFGAVL